MRAKPSTNVTFEVVITLSEVEARALDAIFGYGASAVLDACYAKLGRAYLEPYERGVFSLSETMRTQLGSRLAEVEEWMRSGAFALAGMILLGEAVRARTEELGGS